MPSPESGKDGEPKGGFLDNFFSGRPMKGVPPSEELRARRHGMAMAAAAIGMAGDRGDGLVSAIMQGVVAGHQAAEGVRQAHMEGQLEWAKLAPDTEVPPMGIQFDPTDPTSYDRAIAAYMKAGMGEEAKRVDDMRKARFSSPEDQLAQEILRLHGGDFEAATPDLLSRGLWKQVGSMREEAAKGRATLGENSRMVDVHGDEIAQGFTGRTPINLGDTMALIDDRTSEIVRQYQINRAAERVGAPVLSQMDYLGTYQDAFDGHDQMAQSLSTIMGGGTLQAMLTGNEDFFSDSSGFQDFVLMNNFLEVLDPTSVKKLKEIQTLQAMGSIPDRLAGKIGEWIKGTRLDKNQHRELALASMLLAKERLATYDRNRQAMLRAVALDYGEDTAAAEAAIRNSVDHYADVRSKVAENEALLESWLESDDASRREVAELYQQRKNSPLSLATERARQVTSGLGATLQNISTEELDEWRASYGDLPPIDWN
ncbi:hypothetical protein [Candidatus Poriferisocius sp.]|uniref:hypothetical protein n=1 Tax=Candidatus Poriferisocius sp. TaxID=3101276 RepID=UPI003B520C0B